MPVARRTMWVVAVSSSAKVGKSAGCEVRREASHSPRPSACAGSERRAPCSSSARPGPGPAEGEGEGEREGEEQRQTVLAPGALGLELG